MRIKSLLTAAAFGVAASATAFSAGAVTVSITGNTPQTATGPDTTFTLGVSLDTEGATVDGFFYDIIWNSDRISIPDHPPGHPTPNPRLQIVAGSTGSADYDCSTIPALVAPAQGVRCATIFAVTSATFDVNIVFDVADLEEGVDAFDGNGPAPVGDWWMSAVEFSDGNWVDASIPANVPYDAMDDGAVYIIAISPPTITFDAVTDPLTLTDGAGELYGGTAEGDFEVHAVAGGGTDADYQARWSCTAPAGFTFNPTSGAAIDNTGVADPLATVDVSCEIGQAANLGVLATCTAETTTDGGNTWASVDSQVTLNCPAASNTGPAELDVDPAAGGGPIDMPDGFIGQPSVVTIEFDPISGGVGDDIADNQASISCTTAGDVSVAPDPFEHIWSPGDDETIAMDVTCTLTDADQVGSVTCAVDDDNGARDMVWEFACPAGALAPPPPTFIPAASLWSKLALFGIFAALGLLVLGARRGH